MASLCRAHAAIKISVWGIVSPYNSFSGPESTRTNPPDSDQPALLSSSSSLKDRSISKVPRSFLSISFCFIRMSALNPASTASFRSRADRLYCLFQQPFIQCQACLFQSLFTSHIIVPHWQPFFAPTLARYRDPFLSCSLFLSAHHRQFNHPPKISPEPAAPLWFCRIKYGSHRHHKPDSPGATPKI